jgi:hypothetical protein
MHHLLKESWSCRPSLPLSEQLVRFHPASLAGSGESVSTKKEQQMLPPATNPESGNSKQCRKNQLWRFC